MSKLTVRSSIVILLAVLVEIILTYFSYWTVRLVHHGGAYIFGIVPQLIFSALFWWDGYKRLAFWFFWGLFGLIASTKSYDLIGLARIKSDMGRMIGSIEEYRTKHGNLPVTWKDTGFKFGGDYVESRFQGYELSERYGYSIYFAAPSRGVGYSYSHSEGWHPLVYHEFQER